MSNWTRITAVLDRDPEDWSLLVDCFERHGCASTQQTDNPPTLSGYMAEIQGSDERVRQLSSDLRKMGVANVEQENVQDEDWAETWKKFFKTRRVGKSIVIRPTWESYEPGPNDIEIVLDPGQAFGTGDHPTTRLCLELLQEVEVRGREVADIGCGSGILAIAAVKLGASSVIGSDLDEQSVEISRANARLNDVEVDFSVAAGFASMEKPRPVVLSNIISATLIRLAPEAAANVKAGGRWVVSGIIQQNWPDVLAAANKVGFSLEKTMQEDEWIAAILRR